MLLGHMSILDFIAVFGQRKNFDQNWKKTMGVKFRFDRGCS